MPSTHVEDRRLSLARGGLAAMGLEGLVRADRYVQPEAMSCAVPAAALRAEPDAGVEQITQLLFGETFDVLDVVGGWAFGQGRRDRYVGWVRLAELAPAFGPPTHWVRALRTYAYAERSVKAPVLLLLSMNALVTVEAEDGRFLRVAGAGWVYREHLSPIGDHRDDPVAVALEFLGAPYQWGGRESLGLDCSGLVQSALHACGQTCPRDSDQQALQLGDPIGADDLRRGDLVFWTGHVALMTDADTVVHANGHHMATTVEPLSEAIDRIEAAGFGRPTGYRRLRRL